MKNALFRDKTVAIVGCGGLGGYLVEMNARLGVGHMILMDGDQFSPSNENRQLYATPATRGASKSQTAARRVHEIDDTILVTAHDCMVNADNARVLLRGADVIFDAADNTETKLLLEDTADALHVFLVHGGIQGRISQAALISPGTGLLHRLYSSPVRAGETISFVPAQCACVMCALGYKVLLGEDVSMVQDRVILTDLFSCTMDTL